jgi:hypothetical protein
MVFGEGTYAKFAKKFVFIEHALKYTFHTMTSKEGEKPSFSVTGLNPTGYQGG